MSVIKGNFGKDGGGPPTLDNVDLTHAKTIECEKCGHVNKEFSDISSIK